MEKGPEILDRSPTISRPNDQELLEKLRRKQAEYLGRLGDEYTHPQQAVVMGLMAGSKWELDAYIKHKLLTRVLDEGAVETWTFSRDIIADPVLSDLPPSVQALALERTADACGVINAYCNNDLTQLRGSKTYLT